MFATFGIQTILIIMAMSAVVATTATTAGTTAYRVQTVFSGGHPGIDSISTGSNTEQDTRSRKSKTFRFGIQFRGGLRLPEAQKYGSVSSGPAWGIGAHLNFGGAFGVLPQLNAWDARLRYPDKRTADIYLRDISVLMYYQVSQEQLIFRPAVGLGIGFDKVFAFTASFSAMYALSDRFLPFFEIRMQRASRNDRISGIQENYATFLILAGLEINWCLRHIQ